MHFRKFLKSTLWGFAACSFVAVGSVWSQDGTLSSYESLFDDELFQDVPSVSTSSTVPASSAQPSVAVSSSSEAAVPASSATPVSSAKAEPLPAKVSSSSVKAESSPERVSSSSVAPVAAVPISSAQVSPARSSSSVAPKPSTTPVSSATVVVSTPASSASAKNAPVAKASEASAEAAGDVGTEDWAPAVKYLPTPQSTSPLDGLLPMGGIGMRRGLMNTSKGQIFSHEIDVATREIDVTEKRVNTVSRTDTTVLWTSHYPELADYVSDMYDIGRKRLWLNGLVGQSDGGYEAPETGSVFDISIPVNMPAWMKDFGFNKPKLMLKGSMDVRFKGYGEKDDAEGSTKTSLWPSPSLDYNPSFMVEGKIGPYITVEIKNVDEGLGSQNEVRVVYEESFKGEFEDYILQRVEAGTTNLSLAGTEFTGYSENHQGLFGIKAEWKLGDWRLTTIASQDGGQQEEYSIKANESTTEFQVTDKQFLAYRYYFLNHEARNKYIDEAIKGNTTPNYAATNLRLYKRSALNVSSDVIDDVTVVYTTPQGATVEKVVNRMVEIPSSEFTYDSRTGIVKINGVNRNTLVAASWSGDGTGRVGTTLRDGGRAVLIQWDASLSELTDIDKLMLRNVYSIGISDASSSNFVLRMKDKSGISGSYLKTLGLADAKNGTPLTSDATIFTKDASGSYTGEMWLPCKQFTDSIYKGVSNPVELAKQNCLEPLRNLDSSAAMAQLYTLPVYNLQRYTNRFYFESVGKRRNSTISVRDPNSSYSVNSGSCMDISPGSEKVTAGSTTLIRGTDYEVNYELGQIELLSERALDPNKEIKVKFECEPLFEIDNKLLLGARAELPLDLYGLGAGSVFGVTALYRSQSTTAEVPTLGNEPYSSFLWGVNLRLQDSSKALTDLVNAIPGINTTAQSNWRFEAEFAGSRHNANTSQTTTALVEDFESTATGLVYPLSRLSWYPASPPGGDDSTSYSTYIANQDFRHQGEFIWHSNNTELYKYIYPNVGNSDVDNQHLTVLKMTLRPNDNLMGNSWGGIMRPNGSYYQDMSEMKYIELVARGNSGSIYIDLGLVSEDISINGHRPNGEYDGENQIGMTTAQHDRGLDGKTGADEDRIKWDCRFADCRDSVYTVSNVGASTTDIARDDFKDYDEESDPPVNINGTENNLGERAYDTEDINKNGSLDTDINFVRYRIDLSDTNSANFEKLYNGWRKWRIPLSQYDTIVSPSGNGYKEILAESHFTRVWLGSLAPGVSEAKVQIVSLGVLGNAWEETTVADLYRTTSSEHSQIVEVNGVENRVTESVATRDTTYLKVSTINNRENSNKYYKSPNTVTERDADSNAPLKETALVLDYHNMSPGQEVGVTRLFESDTKNFSSYKSLKMEIHHDSKSKTDKVPVRFALQFGEGSIDGSNDYYEWSFRPIWYNCESDTLKGRREDCHEQNWIDNAFAMDLVDFSDLKRGRHPPYLEPIVKKLKGEREEKREEQLRLVGNPSITKVDWIRFVIIADSNASPKDLEGTFWLNDLRLSEMDTEWGYAARVNGQVNFADFISLSGAVRYQDGDFATLSSSGRSPKPDIATAASQLDVSADISIALNKFLDDSLGFHIPMSFSYHSMTKRPYMKPTDDMILRKSSFVDLTGDMFQNDLAVTSDEKENELRDSAESKGYQSFVSEKSFSVSYHKDYKASDSKLGEFFKQAFLERPALSYSYHQSEGRATTSSDSTYSYHTLLEYKLGTFSMFKFKPFEGLEKISWLKDLSKTEFEPWPQTFDLTLFDFNYVRYVNQTRDPDFVEPQVDKVVTYTAELNHKLNMRWNIFSFLSANYAINIRRDMFGGGDREAFTKENFFTTAEGGLFASGYIFDHDHSDRKVYVSRDSLVIIPVDTVAKGDLKIDLQNPDSYEIRYDTTEFYKVDSVGHREYGRAYGILRNERSRNQQLRINFNPKLIPFIPFNMQFSSDFNQQKSIPDDFDFYDQTNVAKNYWTISQTNRFEFTPTLKILELADLFGKENAVSSFLNKLKWREVKFNWNASTNTVGENFTLAQLYEEQGVTPFQYYLYGLGFGNGHRGRGLWNIMTGDMGLTSRDDFTGFSQYRNKNVDTLVYQGSFRNSVSRSLQISTGLTLPFWDISLTGDFQWKEDFAQSREYPLYIDTTTTLPKIGVGLSIPNIAQKVSFLNSFRSVSLSNRFDYSRTVTKRPFQSAEDSWANVWNFNPLVRISFLTQSNLRIENSVRMKIESTDRRPKDEVIGNPCFPDESVTNCTDTTSYFLETPWIPTALYNDFAINVGDDFTITYPLKLDKGFQLWKWYFKLKNNIDLKLTAGYDYKKTIRKEYTPVNGYDKFNAESGTDGIFKQWSYDSGIPEEYRTVYKPKLELSYRTVPSRVHEWFIRPSASYTFNKMASLSSYIEYRQIHEKLDDETAHMRQILQFELALMLRFD